MLKMVEAVFELSATCPVAVGTSTCATPVNPAPPDMMFVLLAGDEAVEVSVGVAIRPDGEAADLLIVTRTIATTAIALGMLASENRDMAVPTVTVL